MNVNVNTCNVEDLLKIPGVGEKTAQKIINTRGESPFTLHSLSDLLRKDPQKIVEVVTFEDVQKQPDRSHGLSDLKNRMDLCDERNAAFSWEETRPKKHVRSYTPADERREAPPASQYDEGRRRRQYSAEFQEDQHSRYFREHQRSGQLHNRHSRRQYGYDSDESDDEPEHSRKFIQPPKSLIYSGESSWAAFEMKFKRFVREQMFSEKEAKDYLCWVLVGRAADYYTLMMREDRHMPLRQLMKRMEQRFASKHLRETTLIRFQNVKQRIEESIEDWAERLHHLARYAFEKDAGAGLWKRDIKQMVLKFCTGCVDREAGLHAANMRPESLDEATTFILQYQFNHAAVYGRKEDRSPEAAVRSVRSRRDYSEERSPPRREYRGRDATPAWNRAERPQNPGESWGERRDYSPARTGRPSSHLRRGGR
ncbi:general secretion pathway protein k-like protein [Plakobranchus ocellatus]|uniref:General secretion pathway protein k-like protein n=1 Tax=Plakobranchus ocellatus TaxID=259542 RepID=A0AAV4CPF6_9GAST|nr:general secretion pathway protein k-like protein [Plakobranchus ocellatus]